MKRSELEHLIRASARICEEPIFVIVGSQAILGSYPNATEEAIVRSIEADLYPLYAPEKSDRLNAIGIYSRFHDEFGFYADGVDNTTAVLPDGWFDRVVSISVATDNDARVTGLCLEPHDLAISKLIAGREKDIAFVQAAADAGYVSKELLLERLKATRKLALSLRRLVRATIEQLRPIG